MDLLLPFLTAISAALTTGQPTIAAAFPGGFFQDSAPEGTDLSKPYLVFNVVGAPLDSKYGATPTQVAQPRIQFAGYGNVYATVAAAMQILVGVFDSLTIQASGVAHTNTVRLGAVMPRKQSFDRTGNDVWQFATDYRFAIAPNS